jgi:hypothetical protein
VATFVSNGTEPRTGRTLCAKTCVILIPVGHHIEPDCDSALRELERRGYLVRRVWGYSAIDTARNQIASDALRDGFEELFWIDSDVVFRPDDVERLRSHQLPFVCGLYPKKDKKEFACRFPPGVAQVTFGADGKLVELVHVGLGFALVRREVFETVRTRLELPTCNEQFGKPLEPYFPPMMVPDGPGLWYLAEDYAFCERVRRCGFKILADTTVRLWHVGRHGLTWEDISGQMTNAQQ